MTREDVKKLFPEATDEQITSLLNQNNSEVAKEKTKAEKLKKSEKWQRMLSEKERARAFRKCLTVQKKSVR